MFSAKKIQAVILAGGKGQRLGYLGKRIPKALVRVNGNIFLVRLPVNTYLIKINSLIIIFIQL